MTQPALFGAAAAAAALVLSAANPGFATPTTDPPRGPMAAADTADAEDTRFGGGVYLYTYRPVDLPGVDGKSEIYALYGDVSHREGPWEFRLQARWRETKLRPFYPSTTWVQEAWAALSLPVGPEPGEERGGLTLRAGKVYQRIGRFWDGSFFGNVHYFDGLKLDPEFGAEAVLQWPVGVGSLELYGQYLADGDRINGSLAGRDLEGIDGVRESGSFSAGLRAGAPAFRLGSWPVRAEVGVSALLERAEVDAADGGDAGPAREADLDHVALDAELSVPRGRAYVEWTRRDVSGVSPGVPPFPEGAFPAAADADYWLVGVQAELGILHLRYNFSRADYGGRAEEIHQPGLTVVLTDRIHVLLEYDDWTADERDAAGGRLDRSLNGVLLVEF